MPSVESAGSVGSVDAGRTEMTFEPGVMIVGRSPTAYVALRAGSV
jgi:hypothetical protein